MGGMILENPGLAPGNKPKTMHVVTVELSSTADKRIPYGADRGTPPSTK